MIRKFVALLLLTLPVSLFSQNCDIEILRTIYSSETQPSDHFFKFVSDSQVGVVVGIPFTMGIAGLLTDNENLFDNACEIAAATVVNVGATYILKYAVNRPRPYETYPDIIGKSDQGSPSFPSGHTSGAFATATSLSLAYPKWYIIAPSYLWAGTVGYSRIHLGVHYPSDVLGGMILGSGSAWFTYKINKWLNSNYEKKHGNRKQWL